MSSNSAGTPIFNSGYINIMTISLGEVKGLKENNIYLEHGEINKDLKKILRFYLSKKNQ